MESILSTKYLWLYLVLVYIIILMAYNIIRSFRVKNQDDFMVAGRSLSLRVMVFTLICTWIGSGTFIAGARYSYLAGFSSLWMSAGAWIGILVIYFLAAKIRTFGQYTIGDILEIRFGPLARILGALFVIIAFSGIVSYQFKAGGYILNIATDGDISVSTGMTVTAFFVILFTALAGMMAVAYTDLPNGILIVLATCIAVPFVVSNAGPYIDNLPTQHFSWMNDQFGSTKIPYPVLKAGGYLLATMMLLLGVQSMYQKFYSAKTAKEAKEAVALWIIGTIVVETVVVIIAVYAAAKFWQGGNHPNPESMVLLAARQMVPAPVGVLLLGAACAVVISTGMNYLLSPSTNVIRDIYQRFINKEPGAKKVIALQKVTIVIIGVLAYLLILAIPSVLKISLYAYTIYGAAITPALIAALAWKRATKWGGLASIISGGSVGLFLIILGEVYPQIMLPRGFDDADPWGIPIVYFAVGISVISLIIVSYLTKPPSKEDLKKLFPEID